jgi:carbamoylphosphate synthase small subunit
MENIVFMDASIGYNEHMPDASAKKTKQILINVEPSVGEVILRIAESEDRPVGYVARELMIRGLALYRRDGKLRDEGLPSGVFVATLNEPKSKLVAHPSSKEVVRERLMNDAEAAEIASRIKPRKRKAR